MRRVRGQCRKSEVLNNSSDSEESVDASHGGLWHMQTRIIASLYSIHSIMLCDIYPTLILRSSQV